MMLPYCEAMPAVPTAITMPTTVTMRPMRR